jgi:hypothetical protein
MLARVVNGRNEGVHHITIHQSKRHIVIISPNHLEYNKQRDRLSNVGDVHHDILVLDVGVTSLTENVRLGFDIFSDILRISAE